MAQESIQSVAATLNQPGPMQQAVTEHMNPAPTNVYVGRQPIFDRASKVYAYELLYRSTQQANTANVGFDGDSATTQTIINTFMEIGLDRLVLNKLAAINLTEKFLLEDNRIPFTPRQVILEILEDIPVTEPLIQAVSRLAKAGYTIALDDYLYNPAHAPLLKLANIVKIDITLLSKEQLQDHVTQLRKYNVKLLAEKIETPQEFIMCSELGFDYFQGYFLSRPQIIAAEKMPTNRLTVMHLLAVLHNPDSDTDDLAEAINTDVTTSYKLLRMINSAAFNLPRSIESIQQGVLLLGRRKLSSWASMMALSSLNDRPTEILRTAMVRAKMCELLAERAGITPVDSYFTVGMFSALDLIMQRPLPKLLEPLPLSREVVSALLYHKGSLGEALTCVMAYEVADWQHVQFAGLNSQDFLITNIEAVTWASGIIDTL
jgi:EAL and modified HD-GYP domain-containing signal transduction protein